MQWLVDIFSRKGDFVYFLNDEIVPENWARLNADIITGTN